MYFQILVFLILSSRKVYEIEITSKIIYFVKQFLQNYYLLRFLLNLKINQVIHIKQPNPKLYRKIGFPMLNKYI